MWKKWLFKILRFLGGILFLFFISSFCYALYLRWFPPVLSPLMLMRTMQEPYNDHPIKGVEAVWLSYAAQGDNIKLAVIASEDQNFAMHGGFDWEAMEKAMKSNKKGKKVRGGSTISQQVAKNVFLWPGRNYLRKALEAYFTFLIETLWSKERILQVYLNVAETGNGIFGVEAAAQQYFHKSAKKLTEREAALIAGSLPNPRKYIPSKAGTYLLRRQAHILRAMKALKGSQYMEDLQGLD